MTKPTVRLDDAATYEQGVPHEFFDRLRAENPVAWQEEEPPGRGFWAVTRYDDVVRVSRDAQTFSSFAGGTSIADYPPEVLAQQQAMMLNLDPPRHTRQRNLVNRGFTPRMINGLEPRIREICHGLIDNLTGPVDFVRDVAAPLPMAVISELMGAPPEDRDRLYRWSIRMVGFEDPDLRADAEQAVAEIFAYANDLGAQRRAEPRDDIVTKLVSADVDGEALSEMEFVMFFILLVSAGNETTRNAASGGLLAFFEHPDQWRRVLADRTLVPNAVEEILRWVTPVLHFRRTALRDTEIAGRAVREGDKVVVFYPSANRDEAVFADPHRFDVSRNPNPHLAFGGGGPHFCLGAHLAKVELRVLFEVLAERLPDIAPSGPAGRLRSNFFNGITTMPVRLT